MIESFVKRPAMTVVFVSVFVILGLFSFMSLMIERTPKIDLPIVSIAAPYPGASPVDVERQVVQKIEDAVAEISDIKKINSRSLESFGLIMIEFDIKADINHKAIEVKDKVERILNDLPLNAERPIVSRFDPLVVPVQNLVLLSDRMSARDLYEYADRQLKPRLSTVPGVASVDIQGGQKRQINVKLDHNLMQRHFVTLTEVSQEINQRNMNVPGGSVTRGRDELSFRFQGEFTSVDEIRNMPIVSKEGLRLRLGDVATVEDAAAKEETVSRMNQKEAVALAINKLSDGDAVSIGANIRKEMEKIRPQLPEGASLEMGFDSTPRIVSENVDTLVNILIGIILTIVILYVFLGNFRVTFIAAVVIPTSIVSTFLLMDFSGFSINMMTQLAVATALGTLIANAIVIIESVVGRLEAGDDPETAAIVGTKNVTVAILAAAGTNLVVFTPIAFMGGIIGQFMKQFGMTVVYATIFSVIASFSLTPMLCARMLRKRNPKSAGGNPVTRFLQRMIVEPMERIVKFLLGEYRLVFDTLFRFPKLSLIAILLVLLSPALIMSRIGSEFFPASDQDVIRIKIEMPQGTALLETQQAAERVEEIVAQVPELKSQFVVVGQDGFENAQVVVNLKEASGRNRSDLDIINAITPALAQIPDASISISRGDGGGGGHEGDITIEVFGRDYGQMVAISERMREMMLNTDTFRSVTSSHKPPKEEIVFIPDSSRIQANGVNNSEVGNLLRTAITGDDRAVFREEGHEYRINVTLADEYKRNLDDIGRLYVDTKGGLLPLASLGALERRQALPPLQRRDKQRVIQLGGYLSKSNAGAVQAALTESFRQIDFPEGYGYRFAGQAETMAETGQEIGKAFLMAVILTYMLLVAILNSFVHPFTIVTAVFTSFVGVFYFLFFTEQSINIGSMMAFIMLVGLAVNNAILLLDRTMVARREGVGIIDALWVGAESRFRAIAMTSIAVIAGAFPQLFDSNGAKASMGGVVIGGMLGSMFFTFILIPLVYWYLERMIQFSGRLVGERRDEVGKVSVHAEAPDVRV